METSPIAACHRSVTTPPERGLEFLAGGGEMGALMRSIDWSQTPLGPAESWSQTLRMMVRLVLSNRLQMFLWWGPRFINLYNDASWPTLGDKHPRSMGQPASECWPEIWHIIGPLIEMPFVGGPATWMDDIPLRIRRKGFMEETHWTIAYSPVLDDEAPGGIGGVIGTVNEITEKILGERRLLLLRDLAARSSDAKAGGEACAIAAETIARHAADVPFALLYLVDDDRAGLHLCGVAGLEAGARASPLRVRLAPDAEADTPWPLAEAFASEALYEVNDLHERLGLVPPGPWPDPPRMAVVCPIQSNRAHELAGLLVLGVSSHLEFNDAYRGFFELLASQVATAVANARAYEEERKRAEALAAIDRGDLRFLDLYTREAAKFLERRRDEAMLRDTEERFRRYFELGLIGMATTSPTKGCIEVNDELCRILGYPREELLRMNWAEMTHPDDLAADVAQFERVMSGEIDGYTLDKRWIRKDGRVIDSIMAARCQRRPEGSVDYFVGLVLDTSERKRVEEALHKARAGLAHMARVTTMGELAVSIAHEINQPLAALAINSKACLRWLAHSPPQMDEVRAALSRISRDADRASAVIAGVRQLAVKGDPRHDVAVSLQDVIREAAALVKPEAEARRVAMQVRCAPGLPGVIADRVQLQQVVLNLAMNAMDAMEAVKEPWLEIGADPGEDGFVVVTVRDCGAGIDPERRERVFDAFYTTKEGGMGMGLAICRSIVEAHGGRIWAEPGDFGATLRFTLPAV